MYQMTLFKKKVIYKILNCTIFLKIFLEEHAPKRQTPLAKGMASLHVAMCSVLL